MSVATTAWPSESPTTNSDGAGFEMPFSNDRRLNQ